MKIREALAQYEPDPNNHFMTLINSVKLRKSIEDLAERLPAYSFFCWLVIRYTQGLMLPENIGALCNSIGIETVEQLEVWVNAADGQGVLNIIDPVFDVDRTKSFSSSEIEALVRSQGILENVCPFGFGDAQYYFFSEDELKNALSKCPIDRLKYITDKHDCENFAEETKAWFSSHGLGDFAFARTEVNFYKNGNVIGAHGINLAPLRDGRVIMVEPQKDINLWPADQPEFGMGADEMRIRKIDF